MRWQEITIHIIGSVIFLLFPLISSPDFPNIAAILGNKMGLKEVTIHLILLGVFYLFYLYLIPLLFFGRRYALFALSILASLSLVLFVDIAIAGSPMRRKLPPPPMHEQMGEPGLPPLKHRMPPNLIRKVAFSYGFYLYLIVMMTALIISISRRWRILMKEKLEAELSFLKAQINPHFLFNTLNSIYALSIQKSDYTPTAIVKLSGMMRYMISEANRNFVSLAKEVGYINDYIELQKVRLGQTVRINYLVQGDTKSAVIAPLILITFVENAFKYGVNPELESEIWIKLNIDEGEVVLHVTNRKVVLLADVQKPFGLGIHNAKNRLNLLYKNKHILEIKNQETMFDVLLKIELQ